ncbi:unnamed protein product [Brachionus calyciflorus]|uniref:glycogenin glucosyltransferase n=1 Tax=Brachionus calyciflorus TaxID=104777 RepID=A0A814BFR1_9BILA|nr:unnamed protein product [Brachionus calyciflorus]
MLRKKSFFLLLSLFLILYLTLTTFEYFKIKSKNFKIVKHEKPLITSCKNRLIRNNTRALVTQVHDDKNYAFGAIKLIQSAVKYSTYKFDKIILEMIEKPIEKDLKIMLIESGWAICEMNRIPPRDEAGTFPRFRDTFSRLLLWNMTEYEQIIFMDTDVLVVGNIDYLMSLSTQMKEKNAKFAATRDISAGVVYETFNAGVHVLLPDKNMYDKLLFQKDDPNFYFKTTMADQGFLNEALKKDWFDFGFIYNANLAYYTQKRDYWDKNSKNIRVIHYTMEKPWACTDSYKEPCDIWRSF